MNIRLATAPIEPSHALWGPVVRDGLAREGFGSQAVFNQGKASTGVAFLDDETI